MSNPRASVIMVTWNGREWLERSLPPVIAQRDISFELIVVDNGSVDGSVGWIRHEYPRVRIIGNRTNRGFAPANNQGIAVARGEYIALLNNDALPEPGWLATMVGGLEADRSLGSVASRMVRLDDPATFDSAGIAPDVLGFGWNLRAGQPVPGSDHPAPVFGACAGAALYRRTMLEEIGLFDERFESYYEDVDLAWRARNAGWSCRYLPDAVVRHAHSATGARFPSRKRYLLGRNRLWTLIKNYPWPAIGKILPAAIVADSAAALGGLLHGDPAALAGRVAALIDLPVLLARRHALQQRRQADWAAIVPLLAPLGGRNR